MDSTPPRAAQKPHDIELHGSTGSMNKLSEEDYDDLMEIVDNMWELWCEHGKNRERVGEFIQRIGMGNFLEQIGLDPTPEMVREPRSNPYIFFELEEEGDEDE